MLCPLCDEPLDDAAVHFAEKHNHHPTAPLFPAGTIALYPVHSQFTAPVWAIWCFCRENFLGLYGAPDEALAVLAKHWKDHGGLIRHFDKYLLWLVKGD